jgi:type 2 lantibiotic biosynthesis protein LanM
MPVMARLIGTTVLQWIDGTTELVERLDRDLPAIANAFFGGMSPGLVASIATDQSDPHCGGRCVSIVHFADGAKVVYKPKDLRVDIAWAELLQWLDRNGAPVPLRSVPVLPRGTYGWSGFVSADGNVQHHDRSQFHRREGGLLALLHVLRGTDFHSENVIVNGDHPIAIDLETLVRPGLAFHVSHEFGCAARVAARKRLGSSVLATSYLRPNIRSESGDAGVEARSWRHVNTDAMTPILESAASGSGRETAPDPGIGDNLPAFVSGFTDLYTWLMQHRVAIAAVDGPLARFRGVTVRLVLAHTRVLALVQLRARTYQNLRDGAAWSLQFESLGRRFLGSPRSSQHWAILGAERRALANGDIPFFTTRTDVEWLETCPGERIEHCLSASPMDQLQTHIRACGAEDLQFQERLIRATIVRAEKDTLRLSKTRVIHRTRGDIALKAAATRLGNLLVESAIRVDDSAAWVGLVPLDHKRGEVSVLGPDLHAGTTGVALSLAALARFLGESCFADLALAALRPTRSIVARYGATVARQIIIGSSLDIGPIVYGLARIAALLDEPRLLDDATSIASLVDPKLIEADPTQARLSSTARAILGLLALYDANRNDAVIGIARTFGRSLLQASVQLAENIRGRPASGGARPVPTPLAHGSSEIALALLRLHRATQDADFRAAASAALLAEHRRTPEEIASLDLRSDETIGPDPTNDASAYGVAGIVWTGLDCRDVLEDEWTARTIEDALIRAGAARLAPVDHLCCGNLARIDFLLAAGQRLSRAELVRCARDQAVDVVERAEARGTFAYLAGDDRINPSFLGGCSGIAYTLLRVVAPETLPSVLLWS